MPNPADDDNNDDDVFMGYSFPVSAMFLRTDSTLAEVSIINKMQGYHTLNTKRAIITDSIVTLKTKYHLDTTIDNSNVNITNTSLTNVMRAIIKIDSKSTLSLNSETGFDLKITFNEVCYELFTQKLCKFSKEELDTLISWIDCLDINEYNLEILNKYKLAYQVMIVTFVLNYAQEIPPEARSSLEQFVETNNSLDSNNYQNTEYYHTEMTGLLPEIEDY